MKRISILLLLITLVACNNGGFHWEKQDGVQKLFAPDMTLVGQLQETVPDGIEVKKKIEQIDSMTFKVVFECVAEKDVDGARMCFDFVHASRCRWWMIPAVSYNGNQWGRGEEPKGAARDGQWRTVSYRRTSIPCATYSEGERFAVAVWSDTPKNERDGISCALMPEEGSATHRIILPEEEQPYVYYSRDRYADGTSKHLQLRKGEIVKLIMYIHVSKVEPEHRAIRSFMKTAWNMAEKHEIEIFDNDKLWRLGVQYAKESLWAEDGVFKGFSIGLLPDGAGGWLQRRDWKYEIGWCGQNASLANSLLTDYLKTNDTTSRNKALTTLDTWAKYCPLPNGLFVIHFDDILYKRDDYVVDACNLGTAALNFFEATDLARKSGVERPEYERVAYGICDFVKDDQQENGLYARGWYPDGRAYVREGTIGCFMTPPMVEAFRRSRDSSYLLSALKSYNYYISELKNDGYSTAGALDTWCIDKESSIPLLRSALMLYETTGDTAYIDDAITVSYYLSTWLWHYREIYPEDDNFTKYGYSTFGSTSVSVLHNHLDPYALYWIPEWYKLSDLTNDPQWREKAMAIWRNGCQLVSDGTLIINGLQRPAGSQNEAYFECNWGFQYNDGKMPDRINNWLVAWPSAFRLETLRKLGSVGNAKNDSQ